MDVYAESETNLLVSVGVHLILNDNEKREVTSVFGRVQGWPDSEAKRRPEQAK